MKLNATNRFTTADMENSIKTSEVKTSMKLPDPNMTFTGLNVITQARICFRKLDCPLEYLLFEESTMRILDTSNTDSLYIIPAARKPNA